MIQPKRRGKCGFQRADWLPTMWAYWSAFAVVMLWTLGVSWMWALSNPPSHTENVIAFTSLAVVCIIETIALCFVVDWALRRGQISQGSQKQSVADLSQPVTKEPNRYVDERLFWQRQIAVGWWLNGITAVAAVIALVALSVLFGTLNETQRSSEIATNALIASGRSWLTPVRANIISPLDKTSNFGFDIIYRNTGKEPALAFTANEEVGEVPKPNGSWFGVFHRDTLKDICTQTIPATEIAIYPTSETQVYEVRMNKPLSQEVIDGKKVQCVHGCFGYLSPVSEKTIHRSEYCFVFIPGTLNGAQSLQIRIVRIREPGKLKSAGPVNRHGDQWPVC